MQHQLMGYMSGSPTEFRDRHMSGYMSGCISGYKSGYKSGCMSCRSRSGNPKAQPPDVQEADGCSRSSSGGRWMQHKHMGWCPEVPFGRPTDAEKADPENPKNSRRQS